MASKASNIRFPVIRALRVENFPLYPGVHGGGLDIRFLEGVTVVAGMNGIGKTTLLNLLRYMLTGAAAPQKADQLRPGSGRHRMTRSGAVTYFSSRANEPIPTATATLQFVVGTRDKISVTRSLANLKIKRLQHNDTEFAHADEEMYQELVQELTGTNDPWDFDFIVRHLLFFLEEKAPLLWSESGQFELLRALFLDQELSRKAADLYDQIVTLDSQIRNKDWQLDDLRENLKEIDEARNTRPDDGDSLAVVEATLSALRAKLRKAEEREQQLRTSLDKHEAAQFASEQRADETRRRVRYLEHRYFHDAFPKLPQTTELTLGRLLTGDACLVCGCQPQGARERLKRLQKAGACPVCETPQQEDAPRTKSAAKQLQDAESAAAAAQEDAEKAAREFAVLQLEFGEFKNSQRDDWSQRARLEVQLADMHSQRPPADARVEALRLQLKQEESHLQDGRDQLTQKRNQFSVVLEEARQRIAKVSQSICGEFAALASKFLEEECQLEFSMNRRQVGQTGAQMEFPSFILKMTSGTALTPRQRESEEEVSESQKEYLDLAFRMAVMRTAVAGKSPTMLVIETPEASLDSLFVDRAGAMLREFTFEDGALCHTVIASSNLNRENMIPALLGIRGGGRRRTPKLEIPKRVVNLLELAAPPRALRTKMSYYKRQLEKALTGGN